MANEEKKGITVKIDAELHAEVRQYLEDHGMTMAEFITLAIDDELHPKIVEQEEKVVEKMRTLAFQVNEELFQKVKDYLRRNNMSQKEFVIGLIEAEIDRDLAEREALRLQREFEMGAVEEDTDLEQEMEVTDDEEAVSEEADEGDYVEEQDCSSEAVESEDEEEAFRDTAVVDADVPNYSEEAVEEATEEASEETDTDVSEEESDHEDVLEEMAGIDSAEETDTAEAYESGYNDEEDEVCDTELEDESEEDEEAEEEEMTMCM